MVALRDHQTCVFSKQNSKGKKNKSIMATTCAITLFETETFFVNRNSPLALLFGSERDIFSKLIPWIYDSFGGVVDRCLASETWKRRFGKNMSEQSNALEKLKTLPFSAFSFGAAGPTIESRFSSTGFQMRAEDPFVDRQEWYPVTTRDLLLAMRLVIAFKNHMSERENNPSMASMVQSPLTEELLDRELSIHWLLVTSVHKSLDSTTVCHFGPSSSEPTVKLAHWMGPLTLRKIIGMLMGVGYVSDESRRLDAQNVYVANAATSPLFVNAHNDLFKRYPSWRVVVRDGGLFSPRLPAFDVMQDLYHLFEQTMVTNSIMGEKGAL